ncbi:MAG: hypothetical protein RSD63_06750 [Eubacterium sp.]
MSVGELMKRSGKVAFYGVPAVGGTGDPKFVRLKGFTDMSQSKNPTEYSRKYVDEDFEETDVTGYSPSIAYTFDRYRGNEALDDIVKLTDDECTGNAAIREVVVVDMETKEAVRRSFAVVPDTEGDSTDAYTYSGNLKVKGEKIVGTAVLSDENKVCTFTKKSSGETTPVQGE